MSTDDLAAGHGAPESAHRPAAALESLPAEIASPSPPARRSAFRALRSRPFRIYFLGQVVSASGTFLQQTAIAWLVYRITGSPASLGLVLAASGVPSLLFGPWGGSIADRFDLRKLLIATNALFGVLAAALWVAGAIGAASVGLVVSIGVLGGVVQIVDSPAKQAFISALVVPNDLASAISLNGVVVNSARVVGPAIAGALIVTVGTTPCFAVNALSYLAVLAALFVVKPMTPTRRPHNASGGVRSGLHYARGRQQLWLPLTMMSLVGLFAFNFNVVLPVFATRDFNGSGGVFGLMTTLLSIGSVGGSLAVGMIHHPRRIYLVGAALGFGVCLAGTAAAPDVVVAYVLLTLTGTAAFCFVTLTSTTLQLHSSPEYRGRIMALFVFVYIGTTPIGSVVTGSIISASGPRVALFVGAGACLLAAAIGSRVHTPPQPDAALTDLT
jgi:MFS family permease